MRRYLCTLADRYSTSQFGAALLSRVPSNELAVAAIAAWTACSGVKAVSGLAIRSSTQLSKEKVVPGTGNEIAATEATKPSAAREVVRNLTIFGVGW